MFSSLLCNFLPQGIANLSSPVLRLSNVNVLDHGKQYNVTISNIAGTEKISTYVYFKSQITQQPSNIVTDINKQQLFSINVTGFPLPTIQWQKLSEATGQFEDIPGQNEAQIIFPSVTYNDDGSYRCFTESIIETQGAVTLDFVISNTVTLTGTYT